MAQTLNQYAEQLGNLIFALETNLDFLERYVEPESRQMDVILDMQIYLNRAKELKREMVKGDNNGKD
jgi:hypothetical protein